MAEADERAGEGEAAAKPAAKSGGMMGMLINGVGIFALCLGAVVAGGFINGMLHHEAPPEYVLGADNRITVYVPPEEPKKDKKKGKDKAPTPALFYSLDPPLVVNFEESSAVRFLQIGIDIMARDQAVIDSIGKHSPIIRNNLLLLISNRDYQKMMTREGKDELRKEALAEVKKIIKKETGEAEIEDLLFTSFVVQ